MQGPSSRRVLLMEPANVDERADVEQGEEIVFDPRDPASVRRAESMIQARFGLSMAGLLTSEPPEGLVLRCTRAVRAWF